MPDSSILAPRFMLIPSLSCPANCVYCFGPHHGPIMSPDTLEETLNFMARITAETSQQKVKVTFHGGEPLVAGHGIWKHALDGLRERWGNGHYDVALQSNLWLLDDEFCHLFSEHKVDIGSSLDGPEEITDFQRGKGYFARTMKGIRKARSYGMTVGCIATFTPWSQARWREVFDFFLGQRLGMSVHPSLPPLERKNWPHTLEPRDYGNLLQEMLDYYIEHRREISVSSLDQMCQAVGCGEGKVCTFRDCLGTFLAIDPRGDIYPCQRFCGQPDYRLGNLADEPTFADLMTSSVAQRMKERQQAIKSKCKDCDHVNICKGGCPYNAWSSSNGEQEKDPYCHAYRQVYDHITRRVLDEMASEENISEIAARPFEGDGNPLLRRGPLIDLVHDGPNPSRISATARRIVAAVELARGPDIPSVASRLVRMRVARTQQSGETSLTALRRDLEPKLGLLNNLYLHVTFRCQLNCTHCYARADAFGHQQADMDLDAFVTLVREARTVGFRQVVITGGEPLIHEQRDRLLNELQSLRSWAAPMNLVLRTNLSVPLDDAVLGHIAAAVDQLVVSVDGNERTHDDRRGQGAYQAVLQNLEAYADTARGNANSAELSLATVMSSGDIQGAPGKAVRQLASRLGIRRTRFRPLLPLGRAKDWPEPPVSEALGSHAAPMELIEKGFRPIATCGLGQNLYVEPSGDSFPCYALREMDVSVGNVITSGLTSALGCESFTRLARQTVDTNSGCSNCEMRYLCGGACRAWARGEEQSPDAPPSDCRSLFQRASRLLTAALEYLEINPSAEQESCPTSFEGSTGRVGD